MDKILALALIFMVLLEAPTVHSYKTVTKTFTVYFQTITGGPNANFIPVAGAPGRPQNFVEQGTVLVLDVSVTKGTDITSRPVGRAQGILVVTSLNGAQLYTSFSIYFTNGKYDGSTVELQGTISAASNFQGEIAVVGGTGDFRGARGYARFQTVLQNPATNYSVVEYNITLKYELL